MDTPTPEYPVRIMTGGIKCDAEGCAWRDASVTLAEYKDWLNRPCPSCGANLLTAADLSAVELIHATVKWANTMSGPIDSDGQIERVLVKLRMNGTGTVEIDEETAPAASDSEP